MKKQLSILSMSFLLAGSLAGAASAGTVVDLELALLVDVSGSVSASEFSLQQGGYVDAFNDINIWNAIDGGANSSIAVNFIYWSSESQQQTAVGWTLIDSYLASQNFATAIAATARPFDNWTGIGAALTYGADSFVNDYDGTRLVIDISGDGTNNEATSSSAGRDYALTNGVNTINGIVIGGSQTVYNHYLNEVIGGTNPFVTSVSTFEGFGQAIDDKLIREITDPVPEPATMLLFGTGLVGLIGLRIRKKKK